MYRLAPRLIGASALALAVLLAGLFAFGLREALGTPWFQAGGLGLLLLAAWVAATAGGVKLAHDAVDMKRVLIGAILAGALLRIAATLWLATAAPTTGDEFMYPRIAHWLLEQGSLASPDPIIGRVDRAVYPPVFPLLLAGWMQVFGDGALSFTLLNSLIDGGIMLALAAIAARLGFAREGAMAAMVIALWPGLIVGAQFAQKEGLAILLLLLVLHQALAASADTAARRGLAIGLLAGLLALTQPSWLPLAGLFALIGLGRLPLSAVVRAGAAAAVAGLLCMAPWWVRNYLVFGQFVPLTTASGLSLWIANHDGADGLWTELPPAVLAMPELEANRAAGALAWHWMITHPVDLAWQTFIKLMRGLSVDTVMPRHLMGLEPPPARAAIGALGLVGQAAWLALLGGAAVAMARWGRRHSLLVLLMAASFAQLFLFSAWFEFGERHRAFLLPLLALPAALAVCRARQALRAFHLGTKTPRPA